MGGGGGSASCCFCWLWCCIVLLRGRRETERRKRRGGRGGGITQRPILQRKLRHFYVLHTWPRCMPCSAVIALRKWYRSPLKPLFMCPPSRAADSARLALLVLPNHSPKGLNISSPLQRRNQSQAFSTSPKISWLLKGRSMIFPVFLPLRHSQMALA